ncbi:MAG: hypothetical protein EOO14_15350 [Chitinophagaceae bacterium]|nr:MAG: hypothetical protein EOO14_15350 [Chitinophagaceae bacterium]
MKKLLVILLVLVYGLSASGATIHLHYCCGALDKVSLTTDHNPDCPEKGSDKKDCCDSKKLDLKIKADQNLAAKWVTSFQACSEAPVVQYYHQPFFTPGGIETVFTTGPPVADNNIPLFLRYRVFRI